LRILFAFMLERLLKRPDPEPARFIPTLQKILSRPDAAQSWLSSRAVGTVLAGPALEAIKAGKAYYGEVPILGTPYITGYEPIKDSSGAQIGVYYVGYKK
jgi:Single cache domain 3